MKRSFLYLLIFVFSTAYSQVAVIANKSVPLDSVSKAQLLDFYSGDINNYVWGVSNTLYESSQKSGGKIIIINANNGNVIETAAWIIVP